MRKGRDGKRKNKRKKKKKKRMAFLVATTSLPAVYCPNGYARTTTAGTPHTRANMMQNQQAAPTAMLPRLKIQNGCHGVPKYRLIGTPIKFRKITF